MKKFISKTIIISLPVLLTLIFINYFGDAARIFDNEYEKQMAQIIDNKNFVTNVTNFDERIFKKELIKRRQNKPDILVIGSSRTFLVNSSYFPNQELLNISVSGASIEDLIALYQLSKEHQLLPKRIIIDIDPWTFNSNNEQTRWKSIAEYYYHFLKTPYISDDYNKIYGLYFSELFSLSYFKPSLNTFLKKICNKDRLIATKNKSNYTNTWLLDGSIFYGQEYANVPLDKIKERINDYISGSIYSIENFDSISEKNWNDFEKLIKDLQNNNVTIELFLAPYAPLVYNKIKKDYPMVLKTEELIKDFGKENNIKVYGSFNPHELGMGTEYFYDGMHCKKEGITKILGISPTND